MRKDVAIIGGSAAGFYTAYQLAKKGLGVRVFEATDALGPPPRTLIVTSYLSSLIGSLCEDSVINKIQSYDLYADGRMATISLRRPDLVIGPLELIRRLAERAEARGVKILTGRRFLSFKPNGKRLIFTVSSNGDGELLEESADILIGADGAFSKVARSAGWPQQPTVPLVQAVVRLPNDMSSDTTRIWFVPEDTPYF
jgi:flavin-dependent dehydrogenase